MKGAVKQTLPWMNDCLNSIENNAVQELNLNRKGLGDHNVIPLLEKLQKNTSITYLDLSWNGLTTESMKKLANVLLKNSTLRSINLNSNNVDSESSKVISAALGKNKTLTSLKLSWNQIFDEGAKHLGATFNQSLTELEVSCNSIHDEGAKSILGILKTNRNLTSINLEWNEISDEFIRANVPPLLHSNRISSLCLFHNDPVSVETSKIIAASLQANQSLRTLTLGGRIADQGAKYIASSLTRQVYLTHLELASSRITDEGVKFISTALLSNSTITRLNLSANKIGNDGARTIQFMLQNNNGLTYLDLSVNKIGDTGIQYLATALESNFTLTYLDLQQNDFSEEGRRSMETALVDNYSLTELKGMVSDRLLSMTRDMNRATQNEQICASMKLNQWPPDSTQLVDSKMRSYALANPSTLMKLVLHNNLLSSLPSNTGGLTNLRTLVLSRNRLTSPLSSSIGALVSLTRLDLRQNLLESLPSEVGAMTNLTYLNANFNQISTLPPALCQCRNLKSLLLQGNNLDVLPRQFTKLTELRLLDLSKNPLRLVVESVFLSKDHILTSKQHIDKLYAYLSSLGDGEPTKISRVKLMLVGDANVGKTSLRRFLAAGEKVQPSEHVNVTTDGIEIGDLQPKKKDSPTFTTYDFAGQELYYTTHQFFVTDKAIYIVVFSLSHLAITSVKSMATIEYWLKSIRVRTRYAPVILAGTHLDEVGREKAEELLAKLRTQLKHYRVEEYFAVSTVKRGSSDSKSDKITVISLSGNQQHQKELIPFLAHLAEQRKLVGQTVPHSCVQMINFIEEFRRTSWTPIMRFEDFKKVAVGFNIMDVVGTLGILSSMGYVLYFESEPSLRQIVVLNPQFLATLMSSVITLKHDLTKDGKLSEDDFTKVYLSQLSDSQKAASPATAVIIKDQVAKVLNLLEKFEVIFRLPLKIASNSSSSSAPKNNPSASTSESQILVPSMLSPTMSEEFSQMLKLVVQLSPDPDFQRFSRTYNFNFMPLGFFPRLTVRILNFGRNVNVISSWRDGMCFKLSTSHPKASSLPNGTKSSVSKSSINSDNFSDCGYLAYDPMNYKLTVEIICKRNAAALSSSAEADLSSSHFPLLERIIQAVDSIVDVFYSKEKEGMMMENRNAVDVSVSCPHCLHVKKTPTQFNLNHLLESFIESKKVSCNNQAIGKKENVELSELIPDLMMSHLPTLDGIMIDKAVGEGGFATVYKAQWNDQAVAVKELNVQDGTLEDPDSSSDSATATKLAKFKMLHHEIFIMSSFNHPNLVKLIGIANSPLRLVMEFVPCGTLTQVIHQDSSSKSKLTLRKRMLMALDIAKGMQALHAAQPPVVHRDLRSQNIFVQSLEENAAIHVKVGDFGLSQHAFTGLKQYLGGFFWLAPEVLKGETGYTCASDVYSFAIVFWELMTLEVPFAEFVEYVTQREQVLSENEMNDARLIEDFKSRGYVIQGNKIVTQEFKKQDVVDAIVSRNLRPSIPKEAPAILRELCAKCWSGNIDERPTFEYVVSSLSSFLGPIQSVDNSSKNTLQQTLQSSKQINSSPSSSSSSSSPLSNSGSVMNNNNSISSSYNNSSSSNTSGLVNRNIFESRSSSLSSSFSTGSGIVPDSYILDEIDELVGRGSGSESWSRGNLDDVREELEGMQLSEQSFGSSSYGSSQQQHPSSSSSSSPSSSSSSPSPSSSLPLPSTPPPSIPHHHHHHHNLSADDRSYSMSKLSYSGGKHPSHASSPRPKAPNPPNPSNSTQQQRQPSTQSSLSKRLLSESTKPTTSPSNPPANSRSRDDTSVGAARPKRPPPAPTNLSNTRTLSSADLSKPHRSPPRASTIRASSTESVPDSSTSKASIPSLTSPPSIPSNTTGAASPGNHLQVPEPPSQKAVARENGESNAAHRRAGFQRSLTTAANKPPSSLNSAAVPSSPGFGRKPQIPPPIPSTTINPSSSNSITASSHAEVPYDDCEFEITLSWSKPKSFATAACRVAGTNELWFALPNGSISICDNSMTPTGSLEAAQGSGKICVMLATRESVWVGTENGNLIVWDFSSRVIIDTPVPHNSRITNIICSSRPSDSGVWTTDSSGTVRHWNGGMLVAETSLPPIDQQNPPIDPATSTSIDHAIHVEGSATVPGRARAAARASSVHGCLWLAAGNFICVVDSMKLEVLATIEAHKDAIECLAHVGTQIWTASSDGIKVWHQFSIQLVQHVSNLSHSHIKYMYAVPFPYSSRDVELKHIWTFSKDYIIQIFNSSTASLLRLCSSQSTAFARNVIPAAKNRILVTYTDGSVGVWSYQRTKRAPAPPSEPNPVKSGSKSTKRSKSPNSKA